MSVLKNIQEGLNNFERARGERVAAVVVLGDNGAYRIILAEDYYHDCLDGQQKKSLAAAMHVAGTNLLQFDRMEGNG